jgi:hypothetical protein
MQPLPRRPPHDGAPGSGCWRVGGGRRWPFWAVRPRVMAQKTEVIARPIPAVMSSVANARSAGKGGRMARLAMMSRSAARCSCPEPYGFNRDSTQRRKAPRPQREEGESSKLQTPSSRKTPRNKHQPRGSRACGGGLGLGAFLVFGAWSLELRVSGRERGPESATVQCSRTLQNQTKGFILQEPEAQRRGPAPGVAEGLPVRRPDRCAAMRQDRRAAVAAVWLEALRPRTARGARRRHPRPLSLPRSLPFARNPG